LVIAGLHEEALTLDEAEVEASEPGVAPLKGPAVKPERIAALFAFPRVALMEGAALAVSEFLGPRLLEAPAVGVDGGVVHYALAARLFDGAAHGRFLSASMRISVTVSSAE
jgi:hypothetical protein